MSGARARGVRLRFDPPRAVASTVAFSLPALGDERMAGKVGGENRAPHMGQLSSLLALDQPHDGQFASAMHALLPAFAHHACAHSLTGPVRPPMSISLIVSHVNHMHSHCKVMSQSQTGWRIHSRPRGLAAHQACLRGSMADGRSSPRSVAVATTSSSVVGVPLRPQPARARRRLFRAVSGINNLRGYIGMTDRFSYIAWQLAFHRSMRSHSIRSGIYGQRDHHSTGSGAFAHTTLTLRIVGSPVSFGGRPCCLRLVCMRVSAFKIALNESERGFSPFSRQHLIPV